MAIDVKRFRVRVRAELAHIEADLAQAGAAAGTVTLDQSSIGRLSRMDAMQQQAIARGMRERLSARQRKLEAALARIDAGTFGRYCQCEARIESERLEADPVTVFCFECMAERDTDWGHREAR